jgi:multisubunit Na+/H+ antiporter MnhE subunit
MSFSKWTIFEYEYSVVEFVISFIVAALVWYYLIGPLFFQADLIAASLVFGIVIGVLWTYARAHELFVVAPKKK